MSRAIVAAFIVAVAILLGVWMYIQNSPLETCIRSTMYAAQIERITAEYRCAGAKMF